MCFGLDRAQGSSSEEEAEEVLALADDFGLLGEPACRLFGLLLAGSDSVSEEDSSIFSAPERPQFRPNVIVFGVLSACRSSGNVDGFGRSFDFFG